MGIILILTGLILIGIYFSTDPTKASPAPAKLLFAVSGLVAFGLAIYLLYLTGNVQFGFNTLFCLILCGSSVFSGVKLLQSASNADINHSVNIANRASAKRNEAEFVTETYNLENARNKAAEVARLESEKRKTEQLALANQQRELELRNNLADTAEDQGLDVNSVIGTEVRTHLDKQLI